MAKFGIKSQNQATPTAEQNQAEFLALQKNSQRLIDIQTEEYINQKKAEQFGDFGLINADVGQTLNNRKYAPLETKELNQDLSKQPESLRGEEIDAISIKNELDSMSPISIFALSIIVLLIFKFIFRRR